MKKILTAVALILPGLTGCFGGDAVLHKSFNLDRAGLAAIVADQPEAIRKNILDTPGEFLGLVEKMLNRPEELFYLADKKHALRADQTPSKTVRPSEYGIASTRSDREVSALIIDDLKKMTEAARKEGLAIVFASGYRPYDYQEMLFNRYAGEMGVEEAERISARPGTSQHQLGTAVDFGTITDEFADTPEGKWLAEHAGEYGFSLSYPRGMEDVTGYKWECWHYRYITADGITLQKRFFLDVQQYLMEFWHSHSGELSASLR